MKFNEVGSIAIESLRIEKMKAKRTGYREEFMNATIAIYQ